ncbi:MAG: hypothetical protein JEZ06_12395 [Anaerolineaceae bacterium]|nr:hypothetical protein [Anaerolineaceae bacterium]
MEDKSQENDALEEESIEEDIQEEEIPAFMNEPLPEEEEEFEEVVEEVMASPVETKKSGQKSTLIIGITLLGFGFLMLIGRIFGISIGRFLWPFFIITPGAILLFLSFSTRDNFGTVLSILGSMTTSLGLLLLYQSVTNHWASWAYAWALIAPTSVGIGLRLFGSKTSRDNLVTSGNALINIGLGIFVVGAVFFEMLLGISRIGRIGAPLLMVAFGVYLLIRYFLAGRKQ